MLGKKGGEGGVPADSKEFVYISQLHIMCQLKGDGGLYKGSCIRGFCRDLQHVVLMPFFWPFGVSPARHLQKKGGRKPFHTSVSIMFDFPKPAVYSLTPTIFLSAATTLPLPPKPQQKGRT